MTRNELSARLGWVGHEPHGLSETGHIGRDAQRLRLGRSRDARDDEGDADDQTHGHRSSRLTRRMTGFWRLSIATGTPGAVKRLIWLLAM